MICDVSKHQGAIDWSKLAPELDFVVIKASGKWANQGDPRYVENVAGAVAHEVPFHAYHYLYSTSEAEAKRDAGLFYRIVSKAERWPLFWVLDCEAGWGVANARARPIAEAFEAELRRLARANGPGEIRVAVYVAQEKYYAYALDYDRYAYVWIPDYGEKYKPKMPCDIWQYTDKGRLPGVSGNVDLDKLVSDKPMSYYTTANATDTTENATHTTKNTTDGGEEQMFTGKQLAAYAEQVYAHKDHWAYWYGTYGKECTKSLYNSKKAQYPSHYENYRTDGYMRDIAEKRRCADCVGLIKSFFWTGGKYDTDPKYNTNHCPDKSADGLFKMCKQTGPIKSIPDIPGLVVWKSGHIGVYVGGGYTVEMRGFDYDCQRRKVTSGPWTKWGKLPESMISYTTEGAPETPQTPPETPEPTPQGLSRGDHGSAVTAMQRALLAWKPGCLPRWGADGAFGSETEAALKDFQKSMGLPVTGVYDTASSEALAKVEPASPPGTVHPLPDVEGPEWVLATGDVHVRSAPGTDARVLGVLHKMESAPYQGEKREWGGRDWYLIEFKGENGWVSSKYAEVTVG